MEKKLLEVKNLKTHFTLKSDKIGGTPDVVKAGKRPFFPCQ